MRARLADDGCGHGCPLPRNDSTDAARGLWRKIVLFSSELRGFAPSREPVIVGRPGLLPSLTTAQQARKARTTGSGQEREPEAGQGSSRGRTATGRCCPQPRKDNDAGSCQELFLKVSVRPLCALCLCGEIVSCKVIIIG